MRWIRPTSARQRNKEEPAKGGAGGMEGKQLCRTDVDLRRYYMDAQYKFLRILCKKSKGERWVTYEEICKAWKKCPKQDVIANLAKTTYIQIEYKPVIEYFPNPEAFSYVRQCNDSIRNLVVTSATLLVAVWTLVASF